MDSYFTRFDSLFAEESRENDTPLDSNSSGSVGSDSASQTASQGPSAVGPVLRRRSAQERSDDDEEEADDATHKRLKAYSRAASAREGLPPSSLEWFAILPRVYRDIEIMAKLTAHSKQSAQAVNTVNYLSSPEFKRRFYQDLVGCMLSPNIRYYVKTTLDDITALVRQNPTSFKILPASVNNHDEWNQIMRLIGQLLSRVRGAIKAKIEQSLVGYVGSNGNVRTEPQNLVDLTRKIFSLAPHVEIEAAHYPRIAYLRGMYVQFKQLKETAASSSRASTPAPRSLTRSVSTSSFALEGTSQPVAVQDGPELDNEDDFAKRFWMFVDNNLEKCYEDASPTPFVPAQYKANLSAFFVSCFIRDCKQFGDKQPPTNPNGPTSLQQVVNSYYDPGPA
ncbi:hypothetical protein BC629DRAFT_1441561 [Irpex lacteus]|nr:hypothetical protein BC629DRAFT_1441561 [Irpex lacteus]